MATLVFGTDSTTTYGVVQNRSLDNNAEIAEARDHKGKVIAQQAYSKSSERTIEVLFDTAATLPEAGDKVTYDSRDWLVVSCNETDSNTEFKKASIKLSAKDDAELTPLAAETPPAGE